MCYKSTCCFFGRKKGSFDTLRLSLNTLKTSREISVQILRLRFQQEGSVRMNWVMRTLEMDAPQNTRMAGNMG